MGKIKKNHFYKDLSQRTVQRDLQKIRETKLLPLDYQNSKPACWYLKRKDTTSKTPMTEEEAVAFSLVKTFLAKLLPPVEQEHIFSFTLFYSNLYQNIVVCRA